MLFRSGMLDSLIHGKDRDVPCPCQAAMIEHRVQGPERPYVAVRGSEDAIDKVGSRKVQPLLVDGCGGVIQQK